MALKKNYSEGTKYQYARVEMVSILKDRDVSMRVQILERDTSDEELNRLISDESITDNNLIVDELFSISSLSVLGNNVVKECYTYLKANVERFKDFTDC